MKQFWFRPVWPEMENVVTETKILYQNGEAARHGLLHKLQFIRILKAGGLRPFHHFTGQQQSSSFYISYP